MRPLVKSALTMSARPPVAATVRLREPVPDRRFHCLISDNQLSFRPLKPTTRIIYLARLASKTNERRGAGRGCCQAPEWTADAASVNQRSVEEGPRAPLTGTKHDAFVSGAFSMSLRVFPSFSYRQLNIGTILKGLSVFFNYFLSTREYSSIEGEGNSSRLSLLILSLLKFDLSEGVKKS